ncbi:pyridoxal phosphate enzyme, YggS family [Dictyocaulus viviparus]|uniref:Pyridoxal phosphate homeostasis protein n=1 Tax=Dictyocaulus viviparus TaxID=29172 RepID=A0A0D8XXZ2_DICVI|nr:pyridoxal phosphate enzyme, YggS family [Dictyocaulus viviparus]
MSTEHSHSVTKVTAKAIIKVVLELIRNACSRSELSKQCTLVAVSKTKSKELIAACYSIGQRDFGENYIQELEEKSFALINDCPDIKWHYIGKIQSKKIAKLCSIPSLYCVETIESEKHCSLLNKEMEKKQRVLNVFIQVNTSEEQQKGGLSMLDAPDLACYIMENCPYLKFDGFMTIGSMENSHKVPNPDFQRLYEVREKYAICTSRLPCEVQLSMGMSDDFETAIVQGSTVVRVGSKIFGPRLQNE